VEVLEFSHQINFSSTSQAVSYCVGHEGRNGATDFVVVQVGDAGTEEDEHKAHGDGSLSDGRHQNTLGQAYKGDGRLLQEFDGTDQHSRGLGAFWDSLQDALVVRRALQIFGRRGVSGFFFTHINLKYFLFL